MTSPALLRLGFFATASRWSPEVRRGSTKSETKYLRWPQSGLPCSRAWRQAAGRAEPEITTKLTPPNLFERLAGIGVAYLTTISDGVRQVTGRGPTPQDAHEAAQSEWELAHQPNSATMFP
jgi:hypothetical protein